MTTLSQIGNDSGYIYVLAVGGNPDSYPNSQENWMRTKLRVARLRTIHAETKAKEGQTEASKSFGFRVYVDADVAAVIGTIAGTALEVTQFLGLDDRNTKTDVVITSGVATFPRHRAITLVVLEAETGTTDDLEDLAMDEAADGDIVILINSVASQEIAILGTGNIVVRDSGLPLLRTSDVLALAYSEVSDDYRELFRTTSRLKSRDILNVASGGSSLAVDSEAEFLNLIINGGGVTITGNNTVSFPPDNVRLVVSVLIESPAYYNGGVVSVEGVVVPQAMMETGLGAGFMWYDNTSSAWFAFWVPTVERTVMSSGNISQAWQDLTPLVTITATVTAETIFVRRSPPLNDSAYAGVEIGGTITTTGALSHESTYNLFTEIPKWMRPKDQAPIGRLVPVTRAGVKAAVLTCIEITAAGSLLVRPIGGSNLQTGDIINIDRFQYQSDDDI